ncbi:MAG TPA: UvrD-helicase domain-containing protein [Steroidobacteraceae bacterium]|jgi:ATP-dependent exoDNAse (exonuclease V) beta subunit
MNSDPRQDELARELATDPQRSVLLQAPAGSGKTTVLTQRLLRLLAGVNEPEEILAITFTRKAAAEMRARVLKALRGEIDTSTPQGLRLKTVANAALARSTSRGWKLAEDPNRLRIQTIDSFNFRLASQLPITARAGGSLTIAERPHELYVRAARQTLIDAEADEEQQRDAELLFDRLDNRWRNVETLLANMLHKRGHWLRFVLDHEPGALCDRVSESLAHIVREHLERACERLSAAVLQEAGTLPGVGRLGPQVHCHDAWKSLASLSLTLEDSWRQSITKRLGTAFEQGANKDALKSCIESLSRVTGAREILVELRSLPAAVLTYSDAAAIEALSRLLRSAAAHLHAEFSTDGRVDHTYIAGAARAALAEAGLPTDLALQTGLSLRHILVDEFQDTSLAQFDLMQALTAAWEPGDGRTLFVVGDPMQSIYQFREAEVGLFFKAREEGIGPVRLEPLRLLRNFRSVPPLIAWTNKIFAATFPPQDDLRGSAVAFTDSLAAKEAGTDATAVTLQLFSDGEPATEATAIVDRIAALTQADPDDTVAILVASRAHAGPIMARLEESRIAAIGVDVVPLGDVPVVRDLVALVQALHHLADRTAWLAVLRAPWCGVSLATLATLSRRKDPLLVWEALYDPARLESCAESDRVRLTRVREILASAIEERDRAPLADWLESVWLRLGAADCYPADDLRHARAFFAALSDRATSGEWNGPQDLQSLVSDLFAEPQAAHSNPVQIMTIHRAKGLEFDHVFVPALDRNPGREAEPLLRWLDLPRRQGGSDLIIAPVPTIGEQSGGEVGAYLKQLIAARMKNERARLLYVAATRAKQTLWLSGAPKPREDGKIIPRAGTLLSVLWPTLGGDFGVEGAPAADEPASGEPRALADTRKEAIAVRPLRRLRPDWAPAALDGPGELPHLPLGHQTLDELEFSWVQETSRSIGTVVHAAFEQFGRLQQLPARAELESRRDTYEQQLRRHGVPDKLLGWATGTVLDALVRTVGDERGRWIFSAEHREPSSEWALTGVASGRLTNVIIDRSFIDRDGTRWVIDFKTSRHEGGGLEEFLDSEVERYRGQLETYVALASGMGEQPVRAGLYFPLLGRFRELTASG